MATAKKTTKRKSTVKRNTKEDYEEMNDMYDVDESEQQSVSNDRISSLVSFLKQKPLVSIIVVVLVFSGIAYAVMYGGKNVENSIDLGDAEIQDILEAVSKHVVLPQESEQPIVATVNDPELLIAEQPFYTGVVEGDFVLIFSESRRAIIYSPSRDIVVNMGPVVVDGALDAGTTEVTE